MISVKFFAFQPRYSPDIKESYTFHIVSDDAQTFLEQLDKRLIDFSLLLRKIDLSKHDHIKLPSKDVWDVLMRRDSELSQKEMITSEKFLQKLREIIEGA